MGQRSPPIVRFIPNACNIRSRNEFKRAYHSVRPSISDLVDIGLRGTTGAIEMEEEAPQIFRIHVSFRSMVWIVREIW